MREWPVGDRHNFNQRVSVREQGSRKIVLKPRTVFWEHFFLDSRSPFRAFLRRLGAIHETPDFDDILGSLEVAYEQDGGTSSFVTAEPDSAAPDWHVRYGQLVGLASALGFLDLHKGNVLPTSRRAQIVDLECVFHDSILPSETLLIPKAAAEAARSPLAPLPLALEQVDQILTGAESTLQFLRIHRQEVADFFDSCRESLQKAPIRVLLRPTAEYASHLQGESKRTDLLPEEQEQLARDDIPYFFTFLHSGLLYYYSSPGKAAEVGTGPELLAQKLAKAARPPAELLTAERLTRLRKNLLLQLAVRLSPLAALPIATSAYSLQGHGDWLRFRFAELSLQAKMPVTEPHES